jgi:hypothetical protein
MSLFIIRSKKTGEWISILDEKKRIRRRGHTNAHLSKIEPPRLFTSERGAKYALQAWLGGIITAGRGTDWNGDEYEDWDQKPVAGRHEANMEIRRCRVVLL